MKHVKQQTKAGMATIALQIAAGCLLGSGLLIATSIAAQEPAAPDNPAPPASTEQNSPPAEAQQPPATPAADTPPAAETPPAAPPSETPQPAKAVVTTGSEVSFTRLGESAVAERLRLTLQQKSQVEQILAARQVALERAEPQEREMVLGQYEQLLEAVLDQNQRALWSQFFPEAPKRGTGAADQLKFNFRFQPWSDVLSWFAERADLSMVLDAPPPGTFNYTDNRSYTTEEAIDLLNGVLLTKGYTLIRRDRMLMLVNLADGVPSELVPRIEMSELDHRGKFELVSILFPLNGRDAQEVNDEIKPLLGPHGTSHPLPKTKQLMVVEMAGKMRAIRAVIESIPDKRDAAPPASPNEQPTLASYPLGSLSPMATLNVFKTLLPDAKIVHDPNTGHLLAFAVPSQQAVISSTLEQMQADAPDDHKPLLETYVLKGADGSQILTLLAGMMPEARLVLDSTKQQLAAWATPEQQATIRSIIERSGAAPGEDSLEIYPLAKVEPATVLTLLQTLVPKARLAVDARTRSIVAFGSADEQKTIQSTLERLDGDALSAGEPSLQTYTLPSEGSATAMSVLTSAVPTAKLTYDEPNQRLLVMARPAEQDLVRETLAQLAASKPDGEGPNLVVYPLPEKLRVRILAMLETLTTELAGVRKVIDEDGGTVSIWARPDQHAVVSQLITELEKEPADAPTRSMAAYRLQNVEPSSVQQLLTTLMPGVKSVVDAKTRTLAVWARPQEQEQVKATIEQMDMEPPADDRLQLMTHPVRNADPSSALAILRTLLPTAQLFPDAKTGAIVAWASAREQKTIQEAIARLETGPGEGQQPTLVVYPTHDADPPGVVYMLQPLVPNARLTADRATGRVAAWASPEDHQRIKELIAQLETGDSPDWQRKLVVHPLGEGWDSTVVTTLQSIAPTARLTFDPVKRTLAVWARPAEHELLRAAIEELRAGTQELPGRSLVVYPLEGRDASAVLSMLRGMMEDARLVPDATSGSILAWAKADQHEQIKATLDQLKRDTPVAARSTRAYHFEHSDANAAYAVLRQLLPSVPMAIDTKGGAVVVTALEQEHATIQAAVDQLDQAAPPESGQQLAVYPLGGRDPSTIYSLLQSAIPDARFVPDARSGSLLVWAKPDQHAAIKQSLQQIARDAATAEKTARVYHCERIDASATLVTLRTLLPHVTMAIDAPNGSIVATALPQDHDTIRATIDQMEQQSGHEDAPQVAVYELHSVDPQNALTLLTTLMAGRTNVRLSIDARTEKLIAWAPRQQQETIRATLDQLEGDLGVVGAPQLEVYSLGETDVQAAFQVVRALVAKLPGVEIVEDTRGGQLIAFARPAEQAAIRATIDQLRTGAPEVEVFPLHAIDPLSAEFAIQALFSNRGSGGDNRGPKVESDTDRQQLYVRGTKAQLAQVRDLLIKMGETELLATTGQAGGNRVRVISLPPGSVETMLQELQRVWPQVRANPIRVVTPSALIPTLRSATRARQAAEDPPPNAELPNSESEPPPAAPPDDASQDDTESAANSAGCGPSTDTSPFRLAAYEQPETDAEEQQPPAEPAPAPAEEQPPVEPPADAAPPVIIAPGDGSITITSDDPAALDEIEALIKALSGRTDSRGGRQFSIFQLKNVNSLVVADTLQKFFEDLSFGFGNTGRVTVVPEQRLNMLIVRANAADLATIEQLLKILDTSEVPEAPFGNRPQRIQVHNARVTEVASVIEDVFRTQLTTGGRRNQLTLPTGISREFANLISQLNASNAGPEMTMSVDIATNSLVVAGPPHLLVEVNALVTELDKAAINSQRTVQVVPLKQTNVETVEQALEMLFREGGSRRFGRGGYDRQRSSSSN